MLADETFKVFGPLSAVITLLAIVFVLRVNPFNSAKSISYHAAIDHKMHRIYALLMTASILFMGLFLIKWFIPTFGLMGLFTIIVFATITLQLVTTWVPLTTGWKYTIHQYCSYGAALTVPLLFVALMFSQEIQGVAAYITSAAFVFTLGLVLLLLFAKRTRKYYLWYQSSDIAVFYASFLSIAYFG